MNFIWIRTFFLPVCLTALSLTALRATHIVGGEMNYACLGNDNYEISLTIFRDCYNGDPRAWFDDPASIGVFNAENKLLFEIQIPLIGNDTLSPILSDECLVVPPDVCVHTTTYRAVVKLPPIIGGYQLAYQRCCRNQTIANIVAPLATGATYGVTISEKALLECNSNPKFREWPPIYICAGEPILFDQSAADLDGDSIVYRLCTPLAGASQQIPQPQPPNPPPYREIEWLDPPYGLENMLNGLPGGEPLRIDAQTGLLTGLPNTIGQFVVGICVEEYRDGELISTTRRDFQYNVGQCSRTVAAFFAPEIFCDGLTVRFDNQSEEAERFLWSFLRDGEVLDMSTDFSPTYTFPDTGRYEVVLIADPQDACRDTFSQTIFIRYPSLQALFDWDRPVCSDSVQITARDLSTDSLSMIVRRRWMLSPYGLTSESVNPEFLVPAAPVYVLRLEVEAANGCRQSAEVRIETGVVQTDLGLDTLLVCRGDSVRINPGFDPDYQYHWRNSDLFSDRSVPDPLIFPTGSVDLIVDIFNPASGCRITRSLPVLVPPPLDLRLPADTVLCATEWPLAASGNERIKSIFWAEDPDFTRVISARDTAWIAPRGVRRYYVAAYDAFGCSKTGSVQIEGRGIELALPDPVVLCLGEQTELEARALDSLDVVEWSWQLEDAVISGEDGPTPLIRPDYIGVREVVLRVVNQFGCSREERVSLTVLDTLPPDLAVETQLCNDYLVQFAGDHPLASQFRWFPGDPARPGIELTGDRPRYRYSGPGVYEWLLTIGEGSACADTIRRQIELIETSSELAVDYDLLTCSDTALVRLTDISSTPPEQIVDRRWRIGDRVVADSVTLRWVVRTPDSLSVQLILEQTNGCVDTLRERIAFPVLDLVLPDTIEACPGDLLSLNPNPAQPYRYRWSPAAGLSDSTAAAPVVRADTSVFYRLSLADSTLQCRLEAGVLLKVAPAYDFSLPADTVVCERNLTIVAEMSAAGLIAWSDRADFGTLAGRGPSLTVDALANDRWYARATDAYGCSREDSIRVISRAIELEVPSERTLCIGDTLTLVVASLNEQALVYSWSPPDLVIDGQGTNAVRVSPRETTDYRLLVENAFGCRLDTAVRVRIFHYVPPLAVAADRDTLYAPGEVILSATEGETYRYLWSPSTGLSDPQGAVTSVFLDETRTFQLVIRDENGCLNQALITIIVFNPDCVEPNIFVPTAFTPNGDAVNDRFVPRGLNIEEMFLLIYDRWGEEVFRSTTPGWGWDGTYRGAQLAADVYGYYLEIGCANGGRFVKKGNVTLLR